ncbi:MAG: BMP family ABC transporter substrate-binding protein [Lachnospiraceae bacterium]|nr:BMP family ABC transporter substrate-binding protein [Lachnospiraceae bacterium]
MKKIGIAASVVFAVIIIGLMLINIQEGEFDVTKEKTTVGLILYGTAGDKSWGQAHLEGLEASAVELNLRILYREKVKEGAECTAAIEELIGAGCKIIILTSYAYGDNLAEVALKYPQVYFFHAAGVQQGYKNVSTYFGRIYQMRYLSGIVAGLKTETDQIGYVAAHEISEVNRGINAFALGVRSVNPDAVIHICFSGTWTEDDATRTAANSLFDAHDIDVVAMHTDSLAVLKEADARGIYSIGYNYDNSQYFPDTFLTAPVWDWERFYSQHILHCIQGKLSGESYWEGVESGVVSLAPLTKNVSPGTAEKVDQAWEALRQGRFDVFYGPICDNNGNFRVLEGENMSDNALLNEFDWYVAGVRRHEE